jgi:hypothetical protein
MSDFTDKMIENGFEDPEEYMRYLENISFDECSNYYDINFEEDDIFLFENETKEGINFENNQNEKESNEYYILPIDEYWNKVIIKSIGTLIINRRFDRKYCKSNNFSLGFYTYNYFDYHEASISIFCRDINLIEKSYFERILSEDLNALIEANEYYKNELFRHDSDNWKCYWDKIEIIEIDGKKCLMQSYSINEGKYSKLYKRNCYTFFFNQNQIEIETRFDVIRGGKGEGDLKNILDTTINSFKISKKIK